MHSWSVRIHEAEERLPLSDINALAKFYYLFSVLEKLQLLVLADLRDWFMSDCLSVEGLILNAETVTPLLSAGTSTTSCNFTSSTVGVIAFRASLTIRLTGCARHEWWVGLRV